MKFPRTPHIQGSNATEDDIFACLDSNLIDTGRFIATEKMDGSNITIDKHGAYARNGKTPSAEWFYPARDLYHHIGYLLDENITIAGELLTWRKCIAYEKLTSEFLVFSIIDGDTVLSWKDTIEYAELLGLETVRNLATGDYSTVIQESLSVLEQNKNTMEGFVIRNQEAFPIDHYASHVAKYVGEWHQPVAGNNGRNGIMKI